MKIRLKSGAVVSGTCAPIGKNLLKVVLEEVKESHELSDLQLMNGEGKVFGKYSGYTTVYQVIEGGFILSNDGSVYVEPEPAPEPVPEPDVGEIPEMPEITNPAPSIEQRVTALENEVYKNI